MIKRQHDKGIVTFNLKDTCIIAAKLTSLPRVALTQVQPLLTFHPELEIQSQTCFCRDAATFG